MFIRVHVWNSTLASFSLILCVPFTSEGISVGERGICPESVCHQMCCCDQSLFSLSPSCLFFLSRSHARATCVSNESPLFLPLLSFFFLFIDFVYFLSEAMHVSPLSKVFHGCTKANAFCTSTHALRTGYIYCLSHGYICCLSHGKANLSVIHRRSSEIGSFCWSTDSQPFCLSKCFVWMLIGHYLAASCFEVFSFSGLQQSLP